MLWLTENTLAMMCFAPLTGKKDVDVWLLTLEASDFIHSWTCQTECIQAITDECVNRPVVHPSKVTPWQLYDVWDCSLCHPQWFASFAAFFFFLSEWPNLNPLCLPHYGQRCGKCQVYSFIYSVGLSCYLGIPCWFSLELTCWSNCWSFFLGNFLIPPWLRLHVGSNTNRHFTAPQHSECILWCHILSVPVS